MKPCPCSKKNNFSDCCEPFINSENYPYTPEKLMRSRYSAYATQQFDYIASTMLPPAADQFDLQTIDDNLRAIKWVRLDVIRSGVSEDKGYVEFQAYYLEGNQLHILHELSKFILQHDRWFYYDGKPMDIESNPVRTIGRNELCPCQSGKKFKACCLQN